MATQDTDLEREWHRKHAVNQFNLVWELLDKKDRTPDDDTRMIHAAHSSRFHWGEIGTDLEKERGEWQISRVYSVLNIPEAAMRHAKLCLDICRENNIGDFDIAFAYEAMARANDLYGNQAEYAEYRELAEEAADGIEDTDNRNYFLSELKTI